MLDVRNMQHRLELEVLGDAKVRNNPRGYAAEGAVYVERLLSVMVRQLEEVLQQVDYALVEHLEQAESIMYKQTERHEQHVVADNVLLLVLALCEHIQLDYHRLALPQQPLLNTEFLQPRVALTRFVANIVYLVLTVFVSFGRKVASVALHGRGAVHVVLDLEHAGVPRNELQRHILRALADHDVHNDESFVDRRPRLVSACDNAAQ